MGVPSFLKKAFPFIATALTGGVGGPVVALATSLVGKALGTNPKTPEDALAHLAGATPDQLIAAQQAEEAFKVQLASLNINSVEDLEKIAADDRASARNREIQVRDLTPRILAYVYAAGFFGTLGTEIAMAIYGARYKIVFDPLLMKSIDILLGVLTGMVLGTKEYYFGSSAGSKDKDATISKLSLDGGQ